MFKSSPEDLLEAVLDSWDRNNQILVNVLGAIPEAGLGARALPTSPTVAEMFAHLIYVRLVFIVEAAPDWAGSLDPESWIRERDTERLSAGLESSAQSVRGVVADYLRSGEQMKEHYDHPLLFLQHMIWHEDYHHGQIKLALKAAGLILEDEQIGPVTWDLWIEKTKVS